MSFSDGTSKSLGNIKGEKGDKGDAGKDGRGVDDVKITDGYIYIKYTNESDYTKIGAVKDDESIYGNVGSPLKFVLLEDGSYGVKAGATAINYSSLIIPSEYNGLKVTQILDKGFSELNYLEGITIPESIKKIGTNAFYNCFSLKSATIPEGVSVIWDNTFYNCSDLNDISLPSTLRIIRANAFYNCSSLKSVVMPEKVWEILDNAFYNCSSLTALTLPSELRSIGLNVFEGVTSLKSENIIYNGSTIFYQYHSPSSFAASTTTYRKVRNGYYEKRGSSSIGNRPYWFIDDPGEFKKMIAGESFIANCRSHDDSYSSTDYYLIPDSFKAKNWDWGRKLY